MCPCTHTGTSQFRSSLASGRPAPSTPPPDRLPREAHRSRGRCALRIRSALDHGATLPVVPRGCVALGARAASAAARGYQGR
ncbi:MAG: hypothetical protein AAGC93_21460 [Cyanobacteria bacterium P01_F01_bin.53]